MIQNTHDKAGIISSPKLHCQQLEAPELDYDKISETPIYSGAFAIPHIQKTTHQVPCGKHSIFDPDQDVPGFVRAVYLKINEYSDWDSGISNALSLRSIGKLVNVVSHTQVLYAIKWLKKRGWLIVMGKRERDGAHFYKVIHHNCEVSEIPVDKDGRPKKCAVPKGAGSASELLEQGKITWKVFVDWTVRKIHSCWTSGIIALTVREACKLMKWTAKTVSENAKQMIEHGMLKKLSKPFRRSEYQMYPSPYSQRRKRKSEERLTKRAMKLINGWYYSFNELWRFEKETFLIQRREDGRWRDCNEHELLSINPKIHRDFTEYMSHLHKLNRAAQA